VSWRPHREPRQVAGFDVQYMASSTHGHEGAHQVALDGVSVLVAPDGHTTARNRNAVITRALDAIEAGESTALEAFVGALVLGGVTNILVDGQPILGDTPDRVGSIRLDMVKTEAGVEIQFVDLGARK